jgi:hypothetical protein
MNDEAMPHIDYIAQLELTAIQELLSSGWETNRLTGMFALREFLNNVHVLQSISHSQAAEASEEDASEIG